MSVHALRAIAAAIAFGLLAGCSSLEYDLSRVPFEISAKPAAAPAGTFRLEEKSILWAHGLFGQSNPDVTALVRAAAKGHGGILVIKKPWPSMIRTIWGDPERLK